MRILLISSNSSPRGGGEYFLVYLSRALKFFNKNNLLGLYSNKSYMDQLVKRINKNCSKIYRIKYKELNLRKLRFLSSIFDLHQIYKIFKVLIKINPNIIIINQQYDEDALDILFSAILYKIFIKNSYLKIACIMHMPRVKNKTLNQPFGLMRYFLLLIIYGLLKPNFLLTSTECLEEFRSYYFFNKKNASLIKSPLPNIKKNISKKYSLEIINNSKIDELSKEKISNWNKRKKQIILLGCQMKAQKNPIFALSSWIHLRRFYKNPACLLIIGDGPLKKEISIKISTFNKEEKDDLLQINWVNDLSRYILISDLILMPSSFEGMNLTLLECICYKKNIIANKFEGINEIIKFADNCTQLDNLNKEIWSKSMHEKLTIIKKTRQNNNLNKEFISNFSDFECVQSIKKSLAL